MSPRYEGTEAELKQKYGFTDEDLSFLNEMDHAVYGGLIDLSQYIASLKGEFSNLNESEKNNLIAYLLAERFFPFGNTLNPSAEESAKENGLTLPKTLYYRIYAEPMTFGGAAHEIARMVGIEFMGQTQERLRDIIISKFKGIRIDAQVEEQLKRPPEFGGLGLTPEKARETSAVIREMVGRTILLDESKYSEWLAEETRRRHRQAAPESIITRGHEEDMKEAKEIESLAKKMPQKGLEQMKVLNDAVYAIVERLPDKPTDNYLLQRLESIISTRLRDVRSKNEILMKLTREAKVGGMDFDRALAERVTEEIEKGYKEFRSVIQEEEKTRLFKQLADQEKKIVERKRREAEEHTRWYEEKIKSRQVADLEKGKVLERMKVIAQGYTTPIPTPAQAKEKMKEKAAFGELVPAYPGSKQGAGAPSAPISALVAPGDEGAAIKGGALPGMTPEKPIVRVSKETAEAGKRVMGARPKIQDVTVVGARLAGPLQEIGSMNLETLRRLGSPDEAIKKILNSVELLGTESFERRVQGIQAWQGCPLQRVYLSLLAEAFKSAKNVNSLVEEKRKAGMDAPTPEELQAIITLNTKLRL